MKLNVDKFKTKQGINCKWAGKIKTSERCCRPSVIPFPLLLASVLKTETSAQCKLFGVSNYWLRPLYIVYTTTKLPVLQILEEVKIFNCYPCFLLPLTQSQNDVWSEGSASDQKGEENEDRRTELRTQLTFYYAVQRVDANSKRTVGMPKGKRETPWGLLGKSMPEFHHTNCRENVA